MCDILLIRHAHCPAIESRLLGRGAAITLSRRGRAQAEALAASLRNESIVCVQSSPEARCIDTAKPLAELFRVPIQIEPGLGEVDFGAWKGQSFASLYGDPEWIKWNQERTEARPPGGESMAEIQARAVAHLMRTTRKRRSGTVAMVTHAEIIRAVVLHKAGLPLDRWAEFDIALASVTRLACANSRSSDGEEMAA